MLEDILSNNMIELNIKACDWEDAIHKASLPLLLHNKIEVGYIDNMIDTVKELGPYIVIMPGIAFAHGRPGNLVKETCMSLVTLTEPVIFNSDNDPVDIIIAFGAKDSDKHLDILERIAMFLVEKSNVNFLRNAHNKEDVYQRLIGN